MQATGGGEIFVPGGTEKPFWSALHDSDGWSRRPQAPTRGSDTATHLYLAQATVKQRAGPALWSASPIIFSS